MEQANSNATKPRPRTCEQLQVGEGLRQHPSTLFLHRQGDHHETVCQLRKVLNVVVVPEEGEKHRVMTEMFSADGSTFCSSSFWSWSAFKLLSSARSPTPQIAVLNYTARSRPIGLLSLAGPSEKASKTSNTIGKVFIRYIKVKSNEPGRPRRAFFLVFLHLLSFKSLRT